MADSQTFWASDFWAAGFWADDFWAGGVVPPPTPTPEPPAGGGRRIYDPDDKRKRYEPLSKREQRELDRMFRERAAPRYVQPKDQPKVTKRTTPIAPLALPDPKPIRKPAERIAAAKHFVALDTIEGLLDRLEYQPDAQRLYRESIENARALEQHMLQQAIARAEQDAREHAQAIRVQWEAAEQKRMQDEEDEMMAVLLALHEADE